MTNKHVGLASLVAAFAAAPAMACGPALDEPQFAVLTASMVAAPILAALLVDRGAFALAAYATNMPRCHRPTALGPILALLSVVIALSSVGAHDINLAVVGFAFVPAAAAVCMASFLRSVVIDMKGQVGPRLLRLGAVFGFVALALLRLLWS